MSVYIVHYKVKPKDGGKSSRGTIFYCSWEDVRDISDAQKADAEIIRNIYLDSCTHSKTHYATYKIYKL